MTLDEAKAQMAELIAERDSLYTTINPNDSDQSPAGATEPEADQETMTALRDNKWAIERLGCICAGYAHIRPHLSPWMVDVVGTGCNMASQEQLEEGMEMILEGERESFAARAGGSLAQEVYRFINDELQLHSTDIGGGACSWHIGTPCTDAECRELTSDLHNRFKKAIDAGLITVCVRFWGWKFRSKS